jgi:UPF0755 protein
MRTTFRIGIVVIVALFVAYRFYAQTQSWLHAPIPQLHAVMLYEVPRGAAFSSVLNEMHKNGLIEHPRQLSVWVRFTRPEFSLKAGEYELQPRMSPADIVELFSSGKVYLHKLTIVEGITAKELRKLLAEQSALHAITSTLPLERLMEQVDKNSPHPEGQFFPDTYRFAKGTTDLEIYRLAHDRMRKELDSVWAERDPNLPLANSYEALILASIVEKETGLASERPLIAGVFIARLRKGMRLETDPTVIYGMGDRFDGDLRSADLRRDTPYNTRTRAGLPPTPICLPSAAALTAVVHPKETGALYFVATGKGDGSSYFSRTLEEHNAALSRYLKTLRQH